MKLKSSIKHLIRNFEPLNQISIKHRSQLIDLLIIKEIPKGNTITKKSNESNCLHFLIEGTVELRHSFEQRSTLSYDDTACKHALEHQNTTQYTIKSAEDCTLLVADKEKIEQLLTLNQYYNTSYLDDEDFPLADDAMIDDNYHEDWENVFLRSDLTTNLPNKAILEIMSHLEDYPVNKDQTIIKVQSKGDYFYLIKEGTATVNTAPKGPFKGEQFPLVPGNYFGDEALVAHTTRNASVSMSTDGILGRLSWDKFNQLIKQYLIVRAEKNAISKYQTIQVVDVSFATEYQQGADKNCCNIPISFLRQRLPTLEKSSAYVLIPSNDYRTELGVYIMRQAGFQAYLAINERSQQENPTRRVCVSL